MGKTFFRSAASEKEAQPIYDGRQLVLRDRAGGKHLALRDGKNRRRRDTVRLRLSPLGRQLSLYDLHGEGTQRYYGSSKGQDSARQRNEALRLGQLRRHSIESETTSCLQL